MTFGGGGGGSNLMRVVGRTMTRASVTNIQEYGVVDDFLLGPVPSADEVHQVVSALISVVKDKFSYDVEKGTNDEISIGTGLLHRVASAGSEFGRIEPSMHLCNSRALNPHGPSRVYDAIHMLQNPAVQKTVVSLSSDKAFWDAVWNNEAVQELRKAYSSGGVNKSLSCSEISDMFQQRFCLQDSESSRE